MWDGLIEIMGLEQDLKVTNISWKKENKTIMTSGKNETCLSKE